MSTKDSNSTLNLQRSPTTNQGPKKSISDPLTPNEKIPNKNTPIVIPHSNYIMEEYIPKSDYMQVNTLSYEEYLAKSDLHMPGVISTRDLAKNHMQDPSSSLHIDLIFAISSITLTDSIASGNHQVILTSHHASNSTHTEKEIPFNSNPTPPSPLFNGKPTSVTTSSFPSTSDLHSITKSAKPPATILDRTRPHGPYNVLQPTDQWTGLSLNDSERKLP